MRVFFVVALSNSIPVSTQTSEVEAICSKSAMNVALISYDHPKGLFKLYVFDCEDDYHDQRKPLIEWLSEDAQKYKRDEQEKVKLAGMRAASALVH